MKQSAGLLPYRVTPSGFEVLIAHPGGPLWARKDAGAWSMIKGEIGGGEDPQDAARREFSEETGWSAPRGRLISLGTVRQRSGKEVVGWAVESDFDPATLRPGTFTMTWPPGSGRAQEFPEVDRVEWCDPVTAIDRLNPAQGALVTRLAEALDGA